MSPDVLQQIRDLQFTDRSEAEALLLSFLREYVDLDVVAVELRTLAISLNSFNGFMTLADGRRYFFKTHTETDTVIDEYYNAGLLAEVDYPVIQPVFGSNIVGKQILIYEIIEDPSVFDVAWQIETGHAPEALFEELREAQLNEDALLFERYKATLSVLSAESAAKAPIHQLFYHRIMGGRMTRFYGLLNNKANVQSVNLVGSEYRWDALQYLTWTINGQEYDETLADIIGRAARLLLPEQSGPSVVGHGDAHNGNVFLRQAEENALLYFDPAFAGRHHPLLDLVKPVFHNVFAMWMYFPHEKAQQTAVSGKQQGDRFVVEHDYDLHPVRQMFLESKMQNTLLPLLKLLRGQDLLQDSWRAYFKAALFCCPFLTMNLSDADKFPSAISLLGLAMSVEMGSESSGKRSLIDQHLDTLEQELAKP